MICFLLIFGIVGLVAGIESIKLYREAEKDLTKVELIDYLICSYGAWLLTPASIGIIIVSIILLFRN